MTDNSHLLSAGTQMCGGRYIIVGTIFRHKMYFFLLFFVVSLIIHIFTAIKAYKRYKYSHSSLTHHDKPDHAAQRRKPNT